MNTNIFFFNALYCYFSNIWAATQPDYTLFLNNFHSKLSLFAPPSPFYTPSLLLNDTFGYHRMCMYWKNRSGSCPQANVYRPSSRRVLIIAWRTGVAGHAELQVLHLFAILIVQKFYLPHQASRQTEIQLFINRRVSGISPYFPKISQSVLSHS